MARLGFIGVVGADAVNPRFAGLGIHPSAAKRHFLAAGRLAVPFMAGSHVAKRIEA